jgi:hypothetical protein
MVEDPSSILQTEIAELYRFDTAITMIGMPPENEMVRVRKERRGYVTPGQEMEIMYTRKR